MAIQQTVQKTLGFTPSCAVSKAGGSFFKPPNPLKIDNKIMLKQVKLCLNSTFKILKEPRAEVAEI